MTTELVAFLDESRKPIRNLATGRVDRFGRYCDVVAAAVVPYGDSSNLRRRLGRVEAEIGIELHYRDLSTARRAEALEAIDRIDGWHGYMFETARALPAHYNEHHVRAKVIVEAFTHLSCEGVVEAVLETRADPRKISSPSTTRTTRCCASSSDKASSRTVSGYATTTRPRPSCR